jgi:DNA (cytosine-5)-methyltransferase 1
MKYFSLFSGIGGLDYGLHKRAECVGISDIKESSVEIYQKNMGPVKNWGDITKIDFKELPDFDILTGGFPCQSFSLAGLRKGFGDERGKMIFYIYDLLKIKKPKYVVLENVKGIISHNKGKTIRDVVALLISAGYFVRVILLNSIFYGSAQNRERVLFLCAKEDFIEKVPEIKNKEVLFRDIRQKEGPFKIIADTEFNQEKIEQKRQFNFELIGGYDRVGTLTTQEGCGEKLVWEESIGEYRYLTPLECERLQGFKDGWTEGISDNNRYYALGNAVNCNVSEYLFNDYLKDVWEDFK